MEEPGSTLADTCSCSGTSLSPAGAGARIAREAGVVLSPFAPLCGRHCAVSFNDLVGECEPGRAAACPAGSVAARAGRAARTSPATSRARAQLPGGSTQPGGHSLATRSWREILALIAPIALILGNWPLLTSTVL